MIELGLPAVFAQVETALAKEDLVEADRLLIPALDQFSHLPQTWFYAGCIFFARGFNALAALCYEKAYRLEPNAMVLSNWGASLRRQNNNEEALRVLNKAVEYDYENKSTWTNLAASYVNEGNPLPGIEAAKKALKIDPKFHRATWNLGLMELERGNFRAGFQCYRHGIGKERLIRYYTHYSEKDPTKERVRYMTPDIFKRQRGKGKRLVIWDEQGLGDRLMFGSIINEVRKDFEVVFECHPRLEDIFRTAWPDLEIFPTSKDDVISWIPDTKKLDYKMAIGDLGCYYRQDRLSFSKSWEEYGPYYKVNLEEAALFRAGLESVAEGRKIVGLATRGGVIQTMRHYRSVRPKQLDRLLSQKDILFVSLDYENVAAQCEAINAEYECLKIMNFPAVTHAWDYEHTQSLAAACDCLVTVCQSVAHLAASTGIPTFVLVPEKAAWRYGLEGTRWYWYPDDNIRLYRQQGESWDHALDDLQRDVLEFL